MTWKWMNSNENLVVYSVYMAKKLQWILWAQTFFLSRVFRSSFTLCEHGKWKFFNSMDFAVDELQLSGSQAVVDFSSIQNNNLNRRRVRPTDWASARPNDRQANQCFYFSFVRKAHTNTFTHFTVSSLVRILLNFSTAIDLFYKSVYLFFSMKPLFTRRTRRREQRERKEERERAGKGANERTKGIC